MGWTFPRPTQIESQFASNSRSGRLLAELGCALGETEMLDLFHIARSFAETRCPWLKSPPNKA
jgi:hypothetical protein